MGTSDVGANAQGPVSRKPAGVSRAVGAFRHFLFEWGYSTFIFWLLLVVTLLSLYEWAGF